MIEEMERWQRRLERERAARKEAERLLEAKSQELFRVNQALQELTQSLERQVQARTGDLSEALRAAELANHQLQAIQRLQERQIFAIDQHTIASATDVAGDIIYANDRFLQISGYTREELIGANHRLINSGQHPRSLFEGMWDTIAHGKVWSGEIRNRHKSGSFYWVSATIVPFLDEHGVPYQYFSLRTDITPLKLAQASLQQTVFDLGERVKEWTCLNAVTQVLQDDCRNDAQMLQAVVDRIPPGWLEPASTFARIRWGDIECVSAGFRESTWRQVAVVPGGGLACVEVFRLPVPGVDLPFLPEEQTLLDSIAMQIGQALQRREAQRELRIARDAAEAASLAKGDFLANMSHEIRTPMNGIIGMSQLALDAPSEAERREYMQIVKQSAESLLDIINDVLDFSKIEAGKLGIEEVVFDVREAVKLGLHALRLRAREKGLALQCHEAEDVPVLVCGDPTRLRQVLVNLVGNAIKFTERGEVLVQMELAKSGDAAIEIRFCVRDTGIGIAADKLGSIFDAFSQADSSTTRRYGGTGLGLTITQRLVTLMGGSVKVDSTVGQGTSFEVVLPFGKVTQVPAPLPAAGGAAVPELAAAVPAQVDISPQAPLRVLLVEDHPVNQKLAMHLLHKWGHTVTLAQNGQEAVDAVVSGTAFDLVLMDMQMPVMGGIEATRHIRALEAEQGWTPLHIIAMTANAMQSDRDECLAAGMNDYLSKPMRQAELSEKLARLPPRGLLR